MMALMPSTKTNNEEVCKKQQSTINIVFILRRWQIHEEFVSMKTFVINQKQDNQSETNNFHHVKVENFSIFISRMSNWMIF